MFRFVALLACLVVLASARRRFHREVEMDPEEALNANVFNGSPDCKATFGDDSDDYTFEGCSAETMTCFKELRDVMKACVLNEVKHVMALPRAAECRKSHKGLFGEWFNAICKTKMDLKRCMDGEAAPAHEGGGDHDAHDHNQAAKHMKNFKHACWAGLKEKYMACKGLAAAGCDEKMKTCAGKAHSEDAELDKWYMVAKHNKHQIGHKVHHAQHHFKKCLAGDEDHEAHDHGDHSSDSHDH